MAGASQQLPANVALCALPDASIGYEAAVQEALVPTDTHNLVPLECVL